MSKKSLGASIAVLAGMAILLMAFGVGLTPAATTIRYMGGWGAEDDKVNQELIAKFMQKNPDIVVKYENVPDYQQKYLVQMAAGDPPDAVYAFHVWCHTVAGRRGFLDLTSLIERDKAELKMDDFYPGMLDHLSYKGKPYALPTWTAASGVYYNKDIFDEVGLKYPDDTWTWDTLVQVGPKLMKKEGGKILRYAFTPDGFSLSWGTGPIIWVWSNGGDLLSADKKEFKLADPPARQALEYFYDVIYEHQIAVSPAAHQEQNWWLRFLSGTVAIWDSPSWNNTYIGSQAAFAWDISPTFKSPFTGKRSAFIHTRGTAIASITKNKEAAWKLVKYISSPEFQSVYAQDRGYQPTRKSVVGAYYKFAPGGKKVNLKIFEDAIYAAKYIPELDDAKKNTDFWDLVNLEWEKVMLQKQTIDEFYKTVVPQMKDLLR
ncbi:MAG: extracellular solute-binding protein [bacterium]